CPRESCPLSQPLHGRFEVDECFRSKRWDDAFGCIQQADEQASHQQEGWFMLLNEERAKPYGAEWHVTYAVAIQIVPFVIVPVVAFERAEMLAAIGGDVEGVADEVVSGKHVVLRVRHDLYRPAILDE